MGREGGRGGSSVTQSRATNPSTSARWRPIGPQLYASIYPGIGKLRILCNLCIYHTLLSSRSQLNGHRYFHIWNWPQSSACITLCPRYIRYPFTCDLSNVVNTYSAATLFSSLCHVIDTKCISGQVWSTWPCSMQKWYDLVKLNILGISLRQLTVRNVAWVIKGTGRKKEVEGFLHFHVFLIYFFVGMKRWYDIVSFNLAPFTLPP